MGVNMALQPRFGAGEIGDVHGGADDAGIAQGNLGEGERPALAVHHGEAAGLDDAVAAARRCRQFALILVQRRLAEAQFVQVARAGALKEGVITPGDGQALVAQPDRRRQGIENGLVVGCFGGDGRLLQPYRHHAADGAATGDQLAAMGVGHRNLERRAAIREAVNGGGQRQRVGAFEAGLQQVLAAAIGVGPGAVAAPHHQRLAPRAQQGIALADGGLGARAGQAQRAAKAPGDALLG